MYISQYFPVFQCANNVLRVSRLFINFFLANSAKREKRNLGWADPGKWRLARELDGGLDGELGREMLSGESESSLLLLTPSNLDRDLDICCSFAGVGRLSKASNSSTILYEFQITIHRIY